MASPNGVAAVDAASPRAQPNNPSTPPPITQPQQTVQSQQPQARQRPSQLVTSTADGNVASSSTDTSNAVRPHDARTIHMVLASLGVTAYQERVPLQLLDFAYRYTSSVLSDAHHLAVEGYVSSAGGSGGGSSSNAKSAAGAAGDQVNLAALRLATSSRLGYQFSSGLPKQTLLDLAKERNSVQLPDPGNKVVFGLHLPHERYVQTGVEWKMLEEWESEGTMAEDEEMEDGKDAGTNGLGPTADAGVEGQDDNEDEDEDEDMQDGFESVFGKDKADAADGSMDES